MPLIAASGHPVGALAVFDPMPRPWSDDDAQLLVQLAASVVAELELSATRSAVGTSVARLEVALEASSIGIWETDLRTQTVHWDERCAALFGVDGPTEMSLEQVLADFIHPDDHETVRQSMDGAITDRGQFTSESRGLRRDGSVRWMVTQGRVVTDSNGEPVRLFGAILDVTEARTQAEQRLAAFHRATAIAEVAAELANAAKLEDLAEIVLRGAGVLGAQSSALVIFDAEGGPLRLHMTQRLADEVQEHVDYLSLIHI